MKHYVYILQTNDGSYYTGLTRDIQARLDRHIRGRGAKFTKTKKSIRLVYYEETKDIKSAMKREKQIKDFSRPKKEILINEFQNLHNKKI